MLELLSTIIIQSIEKTGYFGIFFLMTIESALIPFPSEVTMPFAGFLVSKGTLSFPLVVLAGAIGNTVGSLIAYALGFYLEEHFMISLIKKYGKFLLITEHEYQRALRWFNKYGSSIAFFSRLMPAVRTFISLPAGLSEMNIYRFIIYTFFGSLLWTLLLTYIGLYLGENWHSLEIYFRKFEYAILAVFVLLGLWYINHKLKIIPLKRSPKK